VTAKWAASGKECGNCGKGVPVLHHIAEREFCRVCIENPNVIHVIRRELAEARERETAS
jgi:hypothetical protein